MRKRAREITFQLLYGYSFTGELDNHNLEIMKMDADLDPTDLDYIDTTYNEVISNFERLKEFVSNNIEGYTVDRIYQPDLVVLILAVYELEKNEVPNAVIINEAVNLAKKFGTDNSGKFVNGVLARFNKILTK